MKLQLSVKPTELDPHFEGTNHWLTVGNIASSVRDLSEKYSRGLKELPFDMKSVVTIIPQMLEPFNSRFQPRVNKVKEIDSFVKMRLNISR